MALSWSEIKRRNVAKVAVAYVVTGWLILQLTDVLISLLELQPWIGRAIVALVAIGFVPAVIFSWVYEVTPDGLKPQREVDQTESITKSTGKKLDRAIIAFLTIAVAVFAIDEFVWDATRSEIASVQDTEKTIAVLPFVDMSPDKDQEYLSDGLAEELLNLLAKVPELRVAARTSSFSFKDKGLEVPEIAERLKVAHVLEGSVRKDGNQIRITAQLIQAKDGFHVWSNTWNRTLDDIFIIQDEIASHVVDELKVTILDQLPQVAEKDSEAYSLYLQARRLIDHRSEESLREAESLLRHAVGIDSDYADAWNSLGQTYNLMTGYGMFPFEEGYGLAIRNAEQALALDPRHARAHATLGVARIEFARGRDLTDAANHFNRAMALAPGDAEIYGVAAGFAQRLGQIEKAIEIGERRLILDPVSADAHESIGLSYRYLQMYEESIEHFRRVLALSPNRISAYTNLGEALLFKGEIGEALVAVEKEPFEGFRLIGLAQVYHALGRSSESDTAVAELIAGYETVAAFNIAYVLAYRGEVDRAFEWLNKAVSYEDPGLTYIHFTPQLTSLESHPRWLPFLESLGLGPARISEIDFNVTLSP